MNDPDEIRVGDTVSFRPNFALRLFGRVVAVPQPERNIPRYGVRVNGVLYSVDAQQVTKEERK